MRWLVKLLLLGLVSANDPYREDPKPESKLYKSSKLF